MTITTVGIDLAKNVFAVHGVDQNGKTVLIKSRVTRTALPGLIAGLPPCVIGMEACSGAHYWARLFRQYGHEPRLMAAKFVSPYRMAGKSGKNDASGVRLEKGKYPTLRLFFDHRLLANYSSGGAVPFLSPKPNDYVHHAAALSESRQNQKRTA